MSQQQLAADPPETPFEIHLLDVGKGEYGDAVLCEFGDESVLIDGGHPGDYLRQNGHLSIPEQIGRLLKQRRRPYRVSLLIVTHAHQDHIGCLPYLVTNGYLTAEWALVADPGLGWARPLARDDTPDATAGALPAQDRRIQQVLAALREEVRTVESSTDAMLAFLSDAADLESRYRAMLATLEQQGTRVVRYGRDNLSALLRRFQNIGLAILGPTRRQLLLCAEEIRRGEQDALEVVRAGFGRDVAMDPAMLYLQLAAGTLDAADAVRRSGAAVNLQSIVTRFAYHGSKFLFTGDMQFARPEVANLEPSLRALRRAIQRDAPYTFVKIAHHGSDDAFDAAFLQELGNTRYFGICTGVDSRSHPNRRTLDLLRENRGRIHWARTDRNRRATFTMRANRPSFRLTTGRIDDATPNVQDASGPGGEPTPPPPTPPPAAGGPPAAPPPAGAPATDVVEVITKVPHTATRVTVAIQVEPGPSPAGAGGGDEPGRLAAPLEIAGGRDLPPLLFVTSREGLVNNIGQVEATRVLQSLRARNMRVYDELPAGLVDSAPAAERVREEIRRHPDLRGVILLGGYDLIPPQRVDVLDPDLRRRLGGVSEPDDFIVWSDDIYGDADGDGLPELPVSRIPDGRTPQLVFTALQAAPRPAGPGRGGVRNVRRPFADAVYDLLPGTGGMLRSEPVLYNQQPPYSLAAQQVYLMLHGSDFDGTRFWGEGGPTGVSEAVTLANVPPQSGAVVLAGCCWGALIADLPAVRALPGQPVAPRTPQSSIALRFLANGAIAFAGCTGAHYSPNEPPFGFFGGPLHAAFWRRYNAGAPPAQALFEAKYTDYLDGMPHRPGSALDLAIEKKILRQFTCLGLGW